ncbi:MAG: GTPase Era, partial [Thermoleophilia bacterium]
ERLKAARLPCIVVVNQIDGLDRDTVARAIIRASELVDFVSLHPVSALTGGGVDELREDLRTLLPEGPRYFPEGAASDQTEEELAAEMIREAALVRLRQEIPHALAVDVQDIEPARDGLVVRAVLVVETESQKGIVVGRGGAMIRAIGQSARESIGHVWGTTVHLDLVVKVRKRWREDESMLERFGL